MNSGEVSEAYFTKSYAGRDHVVIVNGEDAGALIARDWRQISEAEYAQQRELCMVMDLRRKPQQ